MLLASIHLSPALSIPVAIAMSGLFVWYWLRLGQPETPPSRRKIRRFSLAIMLLSLPMFVRALSFVDPAIDKRPYVIAWTAVTFMVLMVIATAVMDAINNLRLHQHQRHQAVTDAAIELAQAIRERRESSGGQGSLPGRTNDDRASEAGT